MQCHTHPHTCPMHMPFQYTSIYSCTLYKYACTYTIPYVYIVDIDNVVQVCVYNIYIYI